MENAAVTGTDEVKPSRARNRRGEGGLLREEIIRAAVELLDEAQDERAVTLRSVARRAGIAAPSIYPHFADQPAIMLAVVQREFLALESELVAAVATAGDSPRDRLRAICDTYLEFALKYPERYRTMFGGLWIPDLAQSSLTKHDLASLGDAILALVVDALRECVAAGQATSDNVEADAVALWLGLHGLAHQRLVSPSFAWPADIVDRIIHPLAHFTSGA